jgi:hypothetical protein
MDEIKLEIAVEAKERERERGRTMRKMKKFTVYLMKRFGQSQ